MPGPGVLVLLPKNFLSEPWKVLVRQFWNFELTYLPFGDKSIPWTVYEPGPGYLYWDIWHLPAYLPKSRAITVLYLAKK